MPDTNSAPRLGDDSLTDARPPLPHDHATGPHAHALVDVVLLDIALAAKSDIGHGHAPPLHSALQSVGANDHHPQLHASAHATAGADAITPANIGASPQAHGHQHAALGGQTPDDHHAEMHKASHGSGAADAVTPAAIGASPTGHGHQVAHAATTGITADDHHPKVHAADSYVGVINLIGVQIDYTADG